MQTTQREVIRCREERESTSFPERANGDSTAWAGGDALEIGDVFGPHYLAEGTPDVLDGRAGDDAIDGGRGDDTVAGGEGDDRILDGLGRDTISAGDGDDFVSTEFVCESSSRNGRCSPPQEAYSGDSVDGGDGRDALAGGLGEDTIAGGPANDFLAGAAEPDVLAGGDGDDVLRGSGGSDALDGGEGSDLADFADAPAAVTLDLAAPSVSGGSDDSLVSIEGAFGSAFADVLNGSEAVDEIYGEEGADVIDGFGGNDHLDGGDGEDEVYGSEGDDALSGGSSAMERDYRPQDGWVDLLDGGPGSDSCAYFSDENAVGCEGGVID